MHIVCRICLVFFAHMVMSASIALGQVSISSVQNYMASHNLEAVTLQGTVRLTPQGGNRFNRCGSYVFILQDDSGSIEIAVRRPVRMAYIKTGDVVQVHAQIQMLSRPADSTLHVCFQAIHVVPLKK